MQEITLELPADYNVPQLFYTSDPSTTAQILTLGSQCYTTMTKEGQKLRYENLFQELQSQAAQEYTPRLETLQKAAKEADDLITAMKRRIQQEEQQRLSMEVRIREEEQRNREAILQEKNSRIQSLEQQLKSQFSAVEQSLKESKESFQTMKETFLKSSTGSKKKGIRAELLIKDMLQQTFGSVGRDEFFHLECKGTEGYQGDIHMNWKDHKVLIEVKHYDRSVDGEEVRKFLRDMDQSRDMTLGILISLESGIVGHTKSGNVDIQELRDGRLCLYLSNFLSHSDPTLFVQSLKPFLETVLLKRGSPSQPSTEDSENEAAIQVARFTVQRSMLLKLLNGHYESTRKFKNTFVNAKKKQEQIWLELEGELRKSEHEVKLLLETLLDTEQNDGQQELPQVEQLTLPDFVFRTTDLLSYSEKEKQFLKDFCSHFMFDTTYSCAKKEIKDTLKPLGYSDETVMKLCERFLLENVWEKGKQKARYLRKRQESIPV
jgi:hypothetical protein